jgi:hypothetical protein
MRTRARRAVTLADWLLPAAEAKAVHGPVHLFGSQQVIWLQVSGDRAYVDLTATSDFFTTPDPFAGDRQVGVVDLAGNRVIARWRGRLPQLLVGGCCDEPSGW